MADTPSDAPCIIGPGIQIRGDLSGSGDLIILGRLEGFISLEAHLDIEETGTVVANIESRGVTIKGELSGDVSAPVVRLATTAVVIGDIHSNNVNIEEGARFRGSLEMDVPLPDDL